MNKATRMSTADRILELAVRNKVELHGIPAYKEAATAIGHGAHRRAVARADARRRPLPGDRDAAAQQASSTPAQEDTHRLDEETGEEVVDDKFLPLHAQLGDDDDLAEDPARDAGQRRRSACCSCATRTAWWPRRRSRARCIQENEVVRISASRNVSEDVLRIIALDREWTRSHQIKLNLVSEPADAVRVRVEAHRAPARARAEGARQEQERRGRRRDGGQAAALAAQREGLTGGSTPRLLDTGCQNGSRTLPGSHRMNPAIHFAVRRG